MTETFFLSVVMTGFVVAFAHAAIPTHWLPFVLAGRGQRWGKTKTLAVVAFCGSGHVLFTTVLGALVVWLGIETSRWTGDVFPWIAGSALILFGLYYLVRQVRGGGHGHHHFGASHSHGAPDHGSHGHASHDHQHHHHGGHDHAVDTKPAAAAKPERRKAGKVRSDGAVILGLFTLLTFSPCEGFLPVYLSGISYGWIGFVGLSAVLALATIAGMMVFTWLTISGIERLRLGFLERYESGILGALILFLGVGIIVLGF
jgi:ABC-type nickel/cobalt efflux system permease component RcnA